MGITISHTDYAPLSLVSTVLGFISFTFSLATLLKVFSSNLGTFSAAPQEVPDFLSSLKQGLLEERRHLRRVRRRLKSLKRDRSHGPGTRSGSDREGGGYGNTYHGERRKSLGSRDDRHHPHPHDQPGRKRRGNTYFERDLQSMESAGEDQAIRTFAVILKNIIKAFRTLEQPFLNPEFQNQDSAHWSSTASPYTAEKPPPRHVQQYQQRDYNLHSDDDSPAVQYMHSTDRMGQEYKSCGFKERWLWVRRKSAFINLNEVLSRIAVRRSAHEIGEVLSMVVNIGRDMEDLRGGLDDVEGRLNRVVGVRRVD